MNNLSMCFWDMKLEGLPELGLNSTSCSGFRLEGTLSMFYRSCRMVRLCTSILQLAWTFNQLFLPFKHQ